MKKQPLALFSPMATTVQMCSSDKCILLLHDGRWQVCVGANPIGAVICKAGYTTGYMGKTDTCNKVATTNGVTIATLQKWTKEGTQGKLDLKCLGGLGTLYSLKK